MDIATLIDYHYWATDRVLGVLDGLTEEQFTRDLGSSFPSVQATVAHLLSAEAVWLSRVTGRPYANVAPAAIPAPAAVRERWQPLREEMQRWAGGLGATAAERSIRVTPSTGEEFLHTGEEVALHLVVHGSYHRGQVATMLRQLGMEPPRVDLINYFRQ